MAAMIKQGVLAAFVSALGALASGDNSVRGGQGSADNNASIGSSIAQSSKLVRTDGLDNHLRNGDFETTTPDGNPEHWTIFRKAYVDADETLARSGVNSARSSFLYGWFQEMLVPVSPFQTFTLHGHANREFEDERAGVRSVYYQPDGTFIKETNDAASIHASAGQYGTFWIPQEVPEFADKLMLFLRGEYVQSWIRFDDLRLYAEGFSTSDSLTGEQWALDNLSVDNPDNISLSSGSIATQRVAAGTENQAYFTWADYLAVGQGELEIREDWLPRTESETTVTRTTTHSLEMNEGSIFSDPGRPANVHGGLNKVTLAYSGDGSVQLTNLRRGFAKVEPPVIVAGPASPDGSLKITAALPGHLTTASITVLSSEHKPVDVPTTVVLYGTTVRAEWDPINAPDGIYFARFVLVDDTGSTITVDRQFEVVREDDAISNVPPLPNDEFLRGIWMFANSGSPASETLALFERAKEDGFGFAVVLSSRNKLADVRSAAEATSMPFVVFVPDVISTFLEYSRRTWFSKTAYIQRLQDILAPVLGSPMYRGVSIYDEPSQPESFSTLAKANLSVAQAGDLGSPFTVFLPDTALENLESVQPAAGVFDLYPYTHTFGGNPTQVLLQKLPVINARVKNFAALDRDPWFLPQAFINRVHEDFYPVPASMLQAQLGAAVMSGVRGIIPFFYNSNGANPQGMRGPSLAPTPLLEPFLRFNQVAARLSPLLMQLETPELEPNVPYPFTVSTANAPNGASYTFVLNADDTATRTLLISYSDELTSSVVDLVAERELLVTGDGAVNVELGPGEWALYSSGAVGTITAMSPLPILPDDSTDVPLPVTHSFQVVRADESGQPVFELEFINNASSLAATIGRFAFEARTPQIYHLQPDGIVVQEPGPVALPAEIFGTTADDLYFTASPNSGVEFFPPGGFFNPAVAKFTGHSGGAWDVIRTADTTWISMASFGVRQLVETPAGLANSAVGRANFGSYQDLFGPFADGSVTALITNYGVANIKPGQLQEFQHLRTPTPGADRNAALGSNNLLAVPLHQYGVALVQLNDNGEGQFVFTVATDTLDATAVTWLYDAILAVADGYKGVRFYHVDDAANATLIGMWRPEQFDTTYALSLDAKVGRLAISFLDGTVLVADTTLLQPDTAAQDWQLLD